MSDEEDDDLFGDSERGEEEDDDLEESAKPVRNLLLHYKRREYNEALLLEVY